MLTPTIKRYLPDVAIFLFTFFFALFVVGLHHVNAQWVVEYDNPPYSQQAVTGSNLTSYTSAAATSSITMYSDYIEIAFNTSSSATSYIGIFSPPVIPMAVAGSNLAGTGIIDYELVVTSVASCRIGPLTIGNVSSSPVNAGSLTTDYIVRTTGTYSRNVNSGFRFSNTSYPTYSARQWGFGVWGHTVSGCAGVLKIYSYKSDTDHYFVSMVPTVAPLEQVILEIPDSINFQSDALVFGLGLVLLLMAMQTWFVMRKR